MSVAPDAVIGAASPTSRCHPVEQHVHTRKKSCVRKKLGALSKVQRWNEKENDQQEGGKAGNDVLHKASEHHGDVPWPHGAMGATPTRDTPPTFTPPAKCVPMNSSDPVGESESTILFCSVLGGGATSVRCVVCVWAEVVASAQPALLL